MNMDNFLNFGLLDMSTTYSDPSFIDIHNNVNRVIIIPGGMAPAKSTVPTKSEKQTKNKSRSSIRKSNNKKRA